MWAVRYFQESLCNTCSVPLNFVYRGIPSYIRNTRYSRAEVRGIGTVVLPYTVATYVPAAVAY